MNDEELCQGLPEFYCQDMYWLVTFDGLPYALFTLEKDARKYFEDSALESTESIHLWRLNGGWLCRPHVDARHGVSDEDQQEH